MRFLELRLRLVLVPTLLIAVGPSVSRAAEITQSIAVSRARVSVERAPAGDRLVVADSKFVYPTEAGQPALPYRLVSVLLPEGNPRL